MRSFTEFARALAQRDITPGGHIEKWLSGIGALIGIAAVYFVSASVLGGSATPLLIASMGASAVLLFALPHSPLSQPWPLVGGNLVSSVIGVVCARVAPEAIAAAAAVGMAITCMYYLRCLHPPGGATALAAVIGGDQVHALGFQFILAPVLLGVVCLLVMAVAFNYLFRWRRYPVALAQAGASEAAAATEIHKMGIGHDDLYYALQHMESYVDVTEQDLEQIYALALQHARRTEMRPEHIVLGRYYSNGVHGEQWSVRRVIDESGVADPARDKVIYRTVAGKDRRSAGTVTRVDFAHWARYEVEFKNNAWLRVERT